MDLQKIKLRKAKAYLMRHNIWGSLRKIETHKLTTPSLKKNLLLPPVTIL